LDGGSPARPAQVSALFVGVIHPPSAYSLRQGYGVVKRNRHAANLFTLGVGDGLTQPPNHGEPLAQDIALLPSGALPPLLDLPLGLPEPRAFGLLVLTAALLDVSCPVRSLHTARIRIDRRGVKC